MKFTCSDLRQFTDEYLKSLSSERKDELCFAFLYDLRDTHDIINAILPIALNHRAKIIRGNPNQLKRQ